MDHNQLLTAPILLTTPDSEQRKDLVRRHIAIVTNNLNGFKESLCPGKTETTMHYMVHGITLKSALTTSLQFYEYGKKPDGVLRVVIGLEIEIGLRRPDPFTWMRLLFRSWECDVHRDYIEDHLTQIIQYTPVVLNGLLDEIICTLKDATTTENDYQKELTAKGSIREIKEVLGRRQECARNKCPNLCMYVDLSKDDLERPHL